MQLARVGGAITFGTSRTPAKLERAKELAKMKGVSTINIALAYVLNQPFPTFALIGPRALSETRTSLPGVGVALTADEVKWLNLEG